MHRTEPLQRQGLNSSPCTTHAAHSLALLRGLVVFELMTHYWDSFVCGLKFDLACFWEVGGNPGEPSNLSWESNQGPWSCEAAMLHHCGQQWFLFCTSYGDSQTPRLTSLESSVRSNFFHCVVNSCCWGYINAPALRISWKASSIVRKAFAQFPLFDSRIQMSFRTTLHSLKVPSVNCVWVADTQKKKTLMRKAAVFAWSSFSQFAEWLYILLSLPLL